MLVLALAERAGDERTWQWFRRWSARPAQISPTTALPDGAASGGSITERAPPPKSEPSSAPSTAADAVAIGGPSSAEGSLKGAAPSPEGAADAIDPQAIQRLWTQLTDAQRKQFAEWVLVGTQPQPLLPPATAETVSWLDQIAGPDAPPQSLPAALRSALAAVAAGQPLASPQGRLLRAVRGVLRQSLLSGVGDGTAIFRPAEREIWLYLLADVRELGSQGLRQRSLGRVAYVQLDQQPEVYRGQVVTVVGRVRRAYRVAALPNPLGIAEYAVYWVLTEGGPDAPVVVYALDIPPGFPSLPRWEEKPGGAAVNEPVEISGVFLKQAAYRGEGGVFAAPLLLAHTPRWQPPPPAPPPRGAGTAAVALAAAALISVALVAWVWRRTQRTAGPRLSGHEPLQLPADLNVTPKLEVALHELEQSAEESPP